MGTLGPFLSRITEKAHESADKQRAEFEKGKQDQIGMWKKVLEGPDSSPEQRKRAADELSKLYNLKGKGDSPFHKLVNFMQHIGGKQSPQAGADTGKPSPNQASGGDNGNFPGLTPEQPKVDKSAPGKTNGKSGVMGKIGSVLESIGGHPPQLPSISPDAFPNADQIRENKTKDLKADLETKWPYEEKKIRLQEELRKLTAAEKSRHASQSKEKYPGQALINGLPEAVRSDITDANGLPIDPNGVYGPATGESASMAMDSEGHHQLNVVRVGTGSAREGTTEQWVYDPVSNTFKKETMKHTTGTPAPPKAASDKSQDGKKREFPELKPKSNIGQDKPKDAKSKESKQSGGGKIPIRAFPYLQKQTNAIHEARASLVGDDPKETGGVAKDIEIFKNPDSVQRVSEYIKFINARLEESGRAVTGSGPMAAVEWYTGLPTTISNLQVAATSSMSQKLDDGAEDGPEHRFVADYYRLLGTWGGMRAATGASAAKWSFKNLISELPTPGPVTSYPEAKRRIINLANESNVVAGTNPMVKHIDTGALYGDYVYATDEKGQLHRAKKGTVLPKGWKAAQAPAE